ncbi:MAG: aminopeptidase P family N-terminal domain-containing protein, partial [Clostridia bacterium]
MKDTKKLFELCNGVDAILVTSPKNRFYFTGFSSTAGFL